MKYDVVVEFEQLERPKKLREMPLTAFYRQIDPADRGAIETEVVYQAHIFARSGDHHGEGPTPAQALVNAALHWERHSR